MVGIESVGQISPSQIKELSVLALRGIQVVTLLFGLALAYLGERIHKGLISTLVFLVGVFVGISTGAPTISTLFDIHNRLVLVVIALLFGLLMVSLVWFVIKTAIILLGGMIGHGIGIAVFGPLSAPLGEFLVFIIGSSVYISILVTALVVFPWLMIAHVAQLYGFVELRDKVLNHSLNQRFDIVDGADLKEASDLRHISAIGIGLLTELLVLGFLAALAYFILPTLDSTLLRPAELSVAVLTLLGMGLAIPAYKMLIALSTAVTGATLVASLLVIRDFLIRLIATDLNGLVELLAHSSKLLLVIFGIVFLTGFGTQLFHILSSDA